MRVPSSSNSSSVIPQDGQYSKNAFDAAELDSIRLTNGDGLDAHTLLLMGVLRVISVLAL